MPLPSAWEQRDVNPHPTTRRDGVEQISAGQNPQQPALSLWLILPEQGSAQSLLANFNLSAQYLRLRSTATSSRTEGRLTHGFHSLESHVHVNNSSCTHALPCETRKLSPAHWPSPCSISSLLPRQVAGRRHGPHRAWQGP